MLTNISLTNFALAESADVDFAEGFNVITGETGAGKSLILQALSLCAGGRSDASVVRFGAAKAQVYCCFAVADNAAVKNWLHEQELFDTDELDALEELLIRRQITDTGRSKAWINGTPVSAGQLKALGAYLLHMHSQHAQQQLLKPSYVVGWFDSVAGTQALVEQVACAKTAYLSLQQKRQDAEQNRAERHARMALLQSQLDDTAELAGLNYDELEAEHETLSNFEAIARAAGQVLALLDSYDGSDELAAGELLIQAQRLAASQSEAAFVAAAEHIELALQHIADASQALGQFGQEDAPDPSHLAQLDKHMAEFHRLAKKYTLKPSALLAQAKAWQAELDELGALSDSTGSDAALEEAKQHWLILAGQLDDKRQACAADIAQDFLKRLRPLSLPEASLEFVFTPPEGGLGASALSLAFSANKGMMPKPVHMQASGGELSRLALVMQVMSAQQGSSLLVFDEVDVGISGATAQLIGKLLHDLGTSRQILAITHQAQVAASAHHHLLVCKDHSSEQTASHISTIANESRVRELARMAGGEVITEETLAHAQSLLATATC